MADYKRLVSYIYSYPGGVRERNVGFAKAEVRNGQFKLVISLKGVYTDTPEIFGVYLMLDKEKYQPGGFGLFKIGTVMVNQGIGQYQDILNPSNLNQSGYVFEDISGIAVARENDRFYMMFSLWEDCSLNPKAVEFIKEGYKKGEEEKSGVDFVESVEDHLEEGTEQTIEAAEVISQSVEVQEAPKEVSKEILEEVLEQVSEEAEESAIESLERNKEESEPEQEVYTVPVAATGGVSTHQSVQEQEVHRKDGFEGVFENADFIDAFDDDYYYDCVEVSPETLKKLPIEDEAIINNSFLIHGFFNFKHILFGKVQENDNNTQYFIGVPGMYCNRERFMASMFGFNNFKKSHRSDFTNPYFGYWYQEI